MEGETVYGISGSRSLHSNRNSIQQLVDTGRKRIGQLDLDLDLNLDLGLDLDLGHQHHRHDLPWRRRRCINPLKEI